MSSKKSEPSIAFFYERLLKKYEKEGFLHPESTLNLDIQNLMVKGGKTEEGTVLLFYRLMIVEGKTREEVIGLPSPKAKSV